MFNISMPTIAGNGLPMFIMWAVIAGVTLLIHFFFAIHVFRDCYHLRRLGEKSFGPGPVIWFFATLIGGVFVATAYWLINHSSLNPNLGRTK
ncbi:MAG: hypothetical protein RRC34_10105 [Lentisphaeria bacterium]|nr:hypothetical protein [Lentisphaeria bacterium]